MSNHRHSQRDRASLRDQRDPAAVDWYLQQRITDLLRLGFARRRQRHAQRQPHFALR
ncbi:hypothetical protein [Opitutus terrae]|uniref:Uncharacterized protein n=1 Tax=Opitutus terrae (strain DSM 11246 / JCM 15787 / PB90-1) TaxID=452637 RepID=B1ZUA3_OPITP|nr:hypothetical protein [Opitutus terrae]ACB76665.1 hypothetical protein Oter_3388 [Opitutus terrae PB90-1]